MESRDETGSEIQLWVGEGKGGMGRESRSRWAGTQATQTSASGPPTGSPRVFVELLHWGPGEPLALLSQKSLRLEGHCGHDLLRGLVALRAHLRVRPDFGGSEQVRDGPNGLGRS